MKFNKAPFFFAVLLMLVFLGYPAYTLPFFMKKSTEEAEKRRVVSPAPTPPAKMYRLTPLPLPKSAPSTYTLKSLRSEEPKNPVSFPSISLKPDFFPKKEPISPKNTPKVPTKSPKVPLVPSYSLQKPTAKNLLGTTEIMAGGIEVLPKWIRVLDKIRAEKPTITACDQRISTCATPTLAGWRQFVRTQQGRPFKAQLDALNTYANQFPYITDDKLWGKSDYWASPLEFLKHSGDCEDYSIIKYVTLRQLGVPAENLRIVVLKDTVRDIAHAVLAVYNGDEIYILDSLFNAVLSHKQMLQYIPYYSINENRRWVHIKPLANR